jgi:type II secretory pathway component GspD/PulD (secretin)
MKNITIFFALSLFFAAQIFPQTYWERQFKTYQNPDELVTMSETLPFNQAIELLSKVSESTTGRRIVSTVMRTDPIGIEIVNMSYDKALLIIVQYANLEFEAKEDVIIVRKKDEVKFDRTADTYASVNTREVKISTIFFDMDVEESRKVGMDWRVLLSGSQTNVAGLLRTETEQQQTGGGGQQQALQPDFNLGLGSTFRIGEYFGEATAIFKFFETNGLGEIIASPSITVRDRNEGYIQIGSDFSVLTRDFAGNTIEKFYPTGTIIKVTPYIHNEDGIDYMLLNISAERSTFNVTAQTTEIRKTNANTQVLMLNGEETIIGGLFLNEEVQVRNGIPFLKDLPWWVFGIRYLTGSDQTITRKKELVILLKAEIVPSLKERYENPRADRLIQEERAQRRSEIRYHMFNE